MSKEIIQKAEEIINAKTDYIGGGMEGYAALSLIDENGYPTTSTLTIAKADGINWLTFCTSLSRNSVKRINKCNKASVCINSSEYNITLVGTIEVLTDIQTKKDNWFPIMDSGEHWTGPEDSEFCVLKFTTESYTLFVGYEEVKGILKKPETKLSFAPMFNFKGECKQAIELYEKVFKAKIKVNIPFSQADPKDFKIKNEKERDFIYHAQLQIGNQVIYLCDDPANILDNTTVGKVSMINLCMLFSSADEVKETYKILSEGATIISPMTSTTYSSCYVYLVDKFGIGWELMT